MRNIEGGGRQGRPPWGLPTAFDFDLCGASSSCTWGWRSLPEWRMLVLTNHGRLCWAEMRHSVLGQVYSLVEISVCGAWSRCWWVGGGVIKVRGVAQYDAKVRPTPMPATTTTPSPSQSSAKHSPKLKMATKCCNIWFFLKFETYNSRHWVHIWSVSCAHMYKS